jgi:hypothetical protein
MQIEKPLLKHFIGFTVVITKISKRAEEIGYKENGSYSLCGVLHNLCMRNLVELDVKVPKHREVYLDMAKIMNKL